MVVLRKRPRRMTDLPKASDEVCPNVIGRLLGAEEVRKHYSARSKVRFSLHISHSLSPSLQRLRRLVK